MKCFIILAEIGTIFLIIQLLRSFKLPEKHVLLYALNPLVIIELSGNLHFEAIMIFFLLLSVYLLVRTKTTMSAVAMGLAIGVKLLPLIFLTFFIKGFKPSQFSKYFAVTGSTLVFLFLPFISWEMLNNLWQSIDLYFQTFEFNASIYYLISWFGYSATGYNIIHAAGPALGLLSLIIILYLAITKKTKDLSILIQAMLLALTVYFVLTTTVHPWYITTLVALTPFIKFRYPIVWSLMVVLSYSAYQTELYRENYVLVWVEYLVVFCWMAYEIRKHKKHLTFKAAD